MVCVFIYIVWSLDSEGLFAVVFAVLFCVLGYVVRYKGGKEGTE